MKPKSYVLTQKIDKDIEVEAFCGACAVPLDVCDAVEVIDSTTKQEGLQIHVKPCNCVAPGGYNATLTRNVGR